jgi:hypothetical protein
MARKQFNSQAPTKYPPDALKGLLPDLTAIVIENSTAQELPLALADAGRRKS